MGPDQYLRARGKRGGKCNRAGSTPLSSSRRCPSHPALWTIPAVNASKLWDIFCKVIDNYGDIGVCWRLSCDLAARGQRVRLWVDDASALAWMAPAGCSGVEVKVWSKSIDEDFDGVGDVLIESFSCEIDPKIVANYLSHDGTYGLNKVWINLEYLSAEKYVKKSHGLPSPVMQGSGAGLSKHFYYPGFTAGTGGLLRESGLSQRQAAFDRAAWLGALLDAERATQAVSPPRLVSLFCYEPAALDTLLGQLAQDPRPSLLLVTAGRAQTATKTVLESEKWRMSLSNMHSSLSILYLPPLTQTQYDELLWACDLNFVRGEDSLVRAIWAGKAFVWQIYPQHDHAHVPKLEAFLDVINAPPSLRQFTQDWNAIDRQHPASASPRRIPVETTLDALLTEWGHTAQAFRATLLAQPDLTRQLMEFVATHTPQDHPNPQP